MNNNNENKNNKQTQEESKGGQPQNGMMKSAFAKRWAFPVIYLAASVLIVGLMYSQSKDAAPDDATQVKDPVAGPALPSDEPAAPANSVNFIWPVGEGGEDAVISMDFYKEEASEEERAAAVIAYEKSFTPNQGVNLGLKSDQSFSVVAAAKGTVTNVAEDPLMGHVVEIDHGSGYTTYYASLSAVEVKKGDKVMQSQPIAKTGNNRFEKAEKNHLHFEIRKDGKAIDPQSMLEKKPSAYEQMKATSTSTPAAPAAEEKQDGAEASNSEATKPEEKKDGANESKTPAGDAKSTDNQPEAKTPDALESDGPDHSAH